MPVRQDGTTDQRQLAPTDALSDVQTALANAAPGLDSIKIGIVDGVPDLTHPSLQSASIEILQLMVPEGFRAPDHHGTAICSVIFGNGDPVRGIAPDCSGLALPIFFGASVDDRVQAASQQDLARAITFALEHGVSIINVSAGQRVAAPVADTDLAQALHRCAEQRVLVVAAAGNDGCACLHVPAGVESVLAVGATDRSGNPLEISNWAAPYRQNGILAPGEGLTVATLDGAIATVSGTSYATAVVSGVAARLLSTARTEGYALDAIDIQRILIESSEPCTLGGDGACDRFLTGTLDVAAALAMVHRLGRPAGQTGPNPYAATLGQNGQANNRLHPSRRKDTTMPEAMLVQSDGTSSKGILPAGCSCQTPTKDEQESTALEQRGEPTISRVPAAPAPLSPVATVRQQECSCGGGQPPQLGYAIGKLWFDFASEAHHDALLQAMGGPTLTYTPDQVIQFLRANRKFFTGVTLVLNWEQTPMYAVQPAGPFAGDAYELLLDILTTSTDAQGHEQRASIPGYVGGSTRLMNGMVLPVIFPDPRGIHKWRSAELIDATRAAAGGSEASDDDLLNFLNRIYYELRNLGVAPQDRALNFAATNAYQARRIFVEGAAANLSLGGINVVKSPICRPNSDCWDVQVTMFDENNHLRSNVIFRYTIDVSEVIPVTVGTIRKWAAPAM